MPHGRVVDGEEAQGVHVEYPHRLRVCLEQKTVSAAGLVGLPVQPRILHSQRGPLGQLASETEVGLGEPAAVFPGRDEGDDPGHGAASAHRCLNQSGRCQSAVDLEMLGVLRTRAQEIVGDLEQTVALDAGSANGSFRSPYSQRARTSRSRAGSRWAPLMNCSRPCSPTRCTAQQSPIVGTADRASPRIVAS